jgi:hypothetical protein
LELYKIYGVLQLLGGSEKEIKTTFTKKKFRADEIPGMISAV